MSTEARGVATFFPQLPEQMSFLSRWAAQRMPNFDGSIPWGPCYPIGFVKDGRLLAVAVYHDYRGHTIMLSGAAESRLWATKPAIRMLFWYPFMDRGVRRVTTITARKNKRARRFNEKVGFTLEGVSPKEYDGKDDACIYGMLRERCRWLDDMKEPESGKEKPVSAASP